MLALPFSSLTMSVSPARDQQFASGAFSRAQHFCLANETAYERRDVVQPEMIKLSGADVHYLMDNYLICLGEQHIAEAEYD